jgi:hypothetical protein
MVVSCAFGRLLLCTHDNVEPLLLAIGHCVIRRKYHGGVPNGILLVGTQKDDVSTMMDHRDPPNVLCSSSSRESRFKLPAGNAGTSSGSSYGAI